MRTGLAVAGVIRLALMPKMGRTDLQYEIVARDNPDLVIVHRRHETGRRQEPHADQQVRLTMSGQLRGPFREA
jgi:hypothetical protein